jgi:hypothetical protein
MHRVDCRAQRRARDLQREREVEGDAELEVARHYVRPVAAAVRRHVRRALAVLELVHLSWEAGARHYRPM